MSDAVATVPFIQMSAKTIELLEEVLEYLEDNYDVRDGSYGEQTPNRAMSLGMQLEHVLDDLKRAQKADRFARDLCQALNEGDGSYKP